MGDSVNPLGAPATPAPDRGLLQESNIEYMKYEYGSSGDAKPTPPSDNATRREGKDIGSGNNKYVTPDTSDPKDWSVVKKDEAPEGAPAPADGGPSSTGSSMMASTFDYESSSNGNYDTDVKSDAKSSLPYGMENDVTGEVEQA